MRAKIAIVHDALVNMGGAERVVGIFHELFPDAPIFTTVYNPSKTYSIYENAEIKTTSLQKIARNEVMVRMMMPLCISQMKKFNLQGFDIVLSSAAWCAKNIFPRDNSLYICYCYAPFRLIWDTEHYFKGSNGWLRNILNPFFERMRREDFGAAQRVKYFLTTCQNTANKIKLCYNKKSEIIFPPIDTRRFKISEDLGDYFLIVSRMVPYKRLDIAVEAFNELGYNLKIVGEGPGKKRLQRLAKKNIQFLGNVTEKKIEDLYSHALALIHPAEEDYGIVFLEAQASGRPVIAYGKGGVLETVIPGSTGLLFSKQEKDSLINAVRRFNASDFNPQAIRTHAVKFDTEVFKNRIVDFIREKAKLQNLELFSE
jgi:glycosyltransferase involved in cell wall biosynthesis